MKKCTLQLKITAIVGLILLLACFILTVNSVFSARSYYGDYALLLEEGMIEYDSALPEGMIPPAMDTEGYYREASNKFSVQSVMAMGLIVILGILATYWASGRMLRPLKELTESVRKVDDQHLDRRAATAKAQGEVLVLAESFNRMLNRLEDAFLIQKSFASNAAHELKTPLAVIKSSLQVLEMDPHPQIEDYREFMQDTGESLERIIKTVEGLLSLANLDAAHTEEIVNLPPLLEQAVCELSARAAEEKVTISLFNDSSAQVRGNTSLLYRTFYNLIENAIKYNRTGGTIQVALEKKGGRVYVKVEDSGIGLEKEALRHIFEPFYRVDQSRSQRISGSGLGLSVVRMIVERHGGEIHVTSEPGAGSSFIVVLNAEDEN